MTSEPASAITIHHAACSALRCRVRVTRLCVEECGIRTPTTLMYHVDGSIMACLGMFSGASRSAVAAGRETNARTPTREIAADV